MEIYVAKGHEDKCWFIEYMIARLSQIGVSEIAIIEDIRSYLVLVAAEHTDTEVLQLELVFLRKHWIRE